MKNKNLFYSLLKSTRIKRTLPILTLILLPAAYVNKFPLSLFIFASVIVLIYSAASIFNAYKDKDYILPKYFPSVIITMLIFAVLLSLTNIIIFISALVFIILGYIYHTKARVIPLGDGLVAGFTHYLIPILVSALLVNMNNILTLQLSTAGYFIGFSFGPITNLKDINKDKKLGYKTLVNQVKNPKIIVYLSLSLIFSILVFMYIILKIDNFYLYLIPLFSLNIIILNTIIKKQPERALNITRFYLILAFVISIMGLTRNISIDIASLFILSIYLFSLFNIK
jgi:4-hydroxybenzoate polyprenyltransferase